MANMVGALIKEARTGAGYTQEQLAKKLDGVTAADISKAERGEKELPQTVLRQIAKLTGVTQSSLINAAKESDYKTASAKKTDTASGSKKSSTTASKTDIQLSAAEKKLVELYRTADADTKKAAVKLLKGEQEPGMAELLNALLGGSGKENSQAGSLIGSLLSSSGKEEGGNILGSILGSALGGKK